MSKPTAALQNLIDEANQDGKWLVKLGRVPQYDKWYSPTEAGMYFTLARGFVLRYPSERIVTLHVRSDQLAETKRLLAKNGIAML